MKKNILVTVFLYLAYIDCGICQNNPIFIGGNADGWSAKEYHQSANLIFIGGNGDGWSANTHESVANEIYKGGFGDGWHSPDSLNILLEIIESSFPSSLTAYPNPTTCSLDVDLGKMFNEISAEIYSDNGKLIYRKQYVNTGNFTLAIGGAKGIYYMKLKTREESATLKIIKQ